MSAGDWKDMFGAACRGDVELVRHHLEQGVDPDHVHPEVQSTALVASILAGHEEVALLLLERGADPAQRSPLDELTPTEAADRAGASRVAARLAALGHRAPAAAPRRGWRSRR